MSSAELPRYCAIDGLAEGLAAAGALGDEASTVLFVPAHCHMHCSALTFLCGWGRQQARIGQKLLIRGDESVIAQLMRLDLHEHLGLAYRKAPAHEETNPFVPLRLILNEQDVGQATIAIVQLVQDHFQNATTFLPALQWAISEILDNALRHADAKEPGAVYSEYSPRDHRLDVAICDLGIGIYASLGNATYLYSHGHAITQAVRRGVTRSEDIGQGNGLAGVLEIVKKNRGDLLIWTGDAVYQVAKGEEKGFKLMPNLPGTGVAFSLDTRNPVNLQDTWIAGQSSQYLNIGQASDSNAPEPIPMANKPPSVPLNSENFRFFDVAQECSSTGLRGPARQLRERILGEMARGPIQLTLDFHSVGNATSSFLDELLGRLAAELGSSVFRDRINIVGMSELIQRMANVVIHQRLAGSLGRL